MDPIAERSGVPPALGIELGTNPKAGVDGDQKGRRGSMERPPKRHWSNKYFQGKGGYRNNNFHGFNFGYNQRYKGKEGNDKDGKDGKDAQDGKDGQGGNKDGQSSGFYKGKGFSKGKGYGKSFQKGYGKGYHQKGYFLQNNEKGYYLQNNKGGWGYNNSRRRYFSSKKQETDITLEKYPQIGTIQLVEVEEETENLEEGSSGSVVSGEKTATGEKTTAIGDEHHQKDKDGNNSTGRLLVNTSGIKIKKLQAPVIPSRPKTSDILSLKNSEFDDYDLKKELLLGIFEKGFDKPSPIQEETIPNALGGNSILARAKNGTGKTAAFSIPLLQKLDTTIDSLQGLILVPTRELAIQTGDVMMELAKHIPKVKICVTTGGSSIKEDIMRLWTTIHVLVSTPGRALDLYERQIFGLDKCFYYVLDEADKLLSYEFKSKIEELLDKSREKLRSVKSSLKQQLLLFSATFPADVSSFAQQYLPDGVEINLMESLTLKGITQYYAFVSERQKLHCLNTLFQKLQVNQAIVFTNSVTRVELLAKKIMELGFSCFYIHSKMIQQDRIKVYNDFRTGNCRCLVSSDLLTRGIDFDTVNVVVNFDYPRTSDTYLHRIGRTGRFGTLGLAINLVTYDDRNNLQLIERELGTKIEPIPKEIDTALYT